MGPNGGEHEPDETLMTDNSIMRSSVDHKGYNDSQLFSSLDRRIHDSSIMSNKDTMPDTVQYPNRSSIFTAATRSKKSRSKMGMENNSINMQAFDFEKKRIDIAMKRLD